MTRKINTLLAAGAIIALTAGAALAQGGPKGPGGGPGSGMGPGMTMGPGMMGMGSFGFSCNPRAAGLAEWRMDRIEAAVKPTDAQKAKLADLRTASTKAAEAITAACAGDPPTKSTERLALMEKRLDAMQQAIKTVRPAFEALYASLDEPQKAKLDAAGPRRWGWSNWRWRWSQ